MHCKMTFPENQCVNSATLSQKNITSFFFKSDIFKDEHKAYPMKLTTRLPDKSQGVKEFRNTKVHILKDFSDYVPQAITSKIILKKITGKILVTSFDSGQNLTESAYRFDNFVQIIDGTAEITIDHKCHKLKVGEGMIIPAHSRYSIHAKERFKIISTVIKSGYED